GHRRASLAGSADGRPDHRVPGARPRGCLTGGGQRRARAATSNVRHAGAGVPNFASSPTFPLVASAPRRAGAARTAVFTGRPRQGALATGHRVRTGGAGPNGPPAQRLSDAVPARTAGRAASAFRRWG